MEVMMVMKNLVFWLLVVWLAVSLPAQQKATFSIEGDGIGYVLLNEVVKLFEEMAPAGDAFRDKIMQGLNRLFGEVRVAREQKHIDKFFFERYDRILLVLKLVMLKADKGKEAADPILDAVIIREINNFDIPQKLSEGGSVQGIGSVAGDVATELLSLKKYLDKLKSK